MVVGQKPFKDFGFLLIYGNSWIMIERLKEATEKYMREKQPIMALHGIKPKNEKMSEDF